MENIHKDEYYMGMAYAAAQKSKDTSTKVGCVVFGPGGEIRTTGYNGAPRGYDDSDPRLTTRPDKYLLVEHSERNAIYNAARVGIPLHGCTMYVTWTPCIDCARAIIQAGITRLVIHLQGQMAMDQSRPPGNDQWKTSQEESIQLMEKCGVIVEWYDGTIIKGLTGIFNGLEFQFVEIQPGKIVPQQV